MLVTLLMPQSAPEPVATPRQALLTVYGANHLPVLRGSPEYVFALASNPARRVFDVDKARRRILVSPAGAGEIWLSCAQVDAPGVCGQSTGRARSLAPPPTVDFAHIPDCPGDPRCPR